MRLHGVHSQHPDPKAIGSGRAAPDFTRPRSLRRTFESVSQITFVVYRLIRAMPGTPLTLNLAEIDSSKRISPELTIDVV